MSLKRAQSGCINIQLPPDVSDGAWQSGCWCTDEDLRHETDFYDMNAHWHRRVTSQRATEAEIGRDGSLTQTLKTIPEANGNLTPAMPSCLADTESLPGIRLLELRKAPEVRSGPTGRGSGVRTGPGRVRYHPRGVEW